MLTAMKSSNALLATDNSTYEIRNTSTLRVLMNNVQKYPLLTREEEVELAIRRIHGDEEARERMITSNLRLVISLSMSFYRRSNNIDLLDIIQEGSMGLVRAIEKWDHTRGIRLGYYAVYWIRAHILLFILKNIRIVKLGTTQAQRRLFFGLGKEVLTIDGYELTNEELADKMGTTPKEVEEVKNRLWNQDTDIEDPHVVNMTSNTIGSQEVIAKNQIKNVVRKYVEIFQKRLSKIDLDILNNRIMSDSPLTLNYIGNKYSLSRERIRQREQKILKKFREFIQKRNPKFVEDYLDQELNYVQEGK
jgi:RNA polymerase sigma-32 factor